MTNELFLGCSLMFLAGCATPDSRLELRHVGVDEIRLDYELYVPTTLQSPAPLVVALHRFSESGTLMASLTGFNEIAEREGFVLVYPNGPGRRFEAWENENRDDVAMVLAILDDVGKQVQVDHRRVYVTGASNGGFLTHRLACLAPEVFAAAAPVMSLMPHSLAEQVPDGPPLPMLIIHGSEDRIVPDDAVSVFAGAKYRVLPIEETVAYWVRRNRSEAEPSRTELPDLDPEDGTRAVLFRHAARTGGVETQYYQVLGGGHTWPGGSERAPRVVVGKTSHDFAASELIWAFFSRHQSKYQP